MKIFVQADFDKLVSSMADVKYVLNNEGGCVKKIEDSETEYKYNFYTGATNIGFRTWEVGIILAHCYNKIQI